MQKQPPWRSQPPCISSEHTPLRLVPEANERRERGREREREGASEGDETVEKEGEKEREGESEIEAEKENGLAAAQCAAEVFLSFFFLSFFFHVGQRTEGRRLAGGNWMEHGDV